jgi:hypothetical protein
MRHDVNKLAYRLSNEMSHDRQVSKNHNFRKHLLRGMTARSAQEAAGLAISDKRSLDILLGLWTRQDGAGTTFV